MRLFLALWPDEALRAGLAGLAGTLRRSISGQWVKPCNLHITLAFLGSVPLERLPPVKELAAGLTAVPFTLLLDKVECWPNGIVCLSPRDTPAALQDLALAAQRKFVQAGFEMDRRPYRAHLTLARKGRSAQKLALLPDTLVWKVDAFSLVESRLERSGSVYAVLERWALGSGKNRIANPACLAE